MDLRGFFALVLLPVVITCVIHIKDVYGSRIAAKEEDLEIENQLKRLNKSSVKTVKTIVGDIYDCVDIRKQPALDNPLLRNHEIQMQPSSSLVDRKTLQKMRSENQPTVDCPKGTVPIRRIGKEGLIRAKLFAKTYATNNHKLTTDAPGQHFAILRSKRDSKKTLLGIEAFMSIHELDIGPLQSSSTEIWLERGSNSLHTGLMISPLLYGDSRTRLFAYWKTNNGGCFNLHCNPGFVQVNRNEPVDQAFNGSVYGGNQYVMSLRIEKDSKTGNWWIIATDQVYVGYWPAGLLPDLDKNGASYYHWGGIVNGRVGEPSPPMGSGISYPVVIGFTADVSSLQIADQYNSWGLPDMNQVEAYDDNRNCYLLKYVGDLRQSYGLTFFYGGPGGKCGI